MPYYSFSVTNGQQTVSDTSESSLADDAAARAYATLLARNLFRTGADWQGWEVQVRDEADQVIAFVPISPVYGA